MPSTKTTRPRVTRSDISAVMRALRRKVKPENCARTSEQARNAARVRWAKVQAEKINAVG